VPPDRDRQLIAIGADMHIYTSKLINYGRYSLAVLAAAALVGPPCARAADRGADWANDPGLDATGELAAGVLNGSAPTTGSPLGKVSPCPAEPSPSGNVQVNCRAQDGTSLQNTQSETSVAATGTKVVVGYNDDLVCCIPVADLAGYSVSTDDGRTFTDMGQLPIVRDIQPIGDPSVAADGSGNVYYATLAFNSAPGQGSLSLIALYEMPAGSNTFKFLSVAADVGSSERAFADKEYLAIGRDGAGRTHFYVSYTDFTNAFPGAPIVLADSTDGIHWRSTPISDPAGCSEGSQPLPAGAKLHVAYVQFNSCGADIFRAGGSERMATFDVASGNVDRITTIALEKGSGDRLTACGGPTDVREVIETAPGHDIRNNEFPSVARDARGVLYAIWNDRPNGIGGDNANATRIYLSYSTDDNRTWSAPQAISPSPSSATMNDRFQPWLTVDRDGLHAMWYERVPGSPVDLIRTDKEDLTPAGPNNAPASLGETPLSTLAFPVTQTNPNQDIFANCYMGDYNNIATNGTTRFVTWSDNRNIVQTPSGFENQPDVFLASY
jgi:hypothetical protein